MPDLVLHAFHEALGATFTEVRGTPWVANYGNVEAEHRALTATAGILDLASRGRLVLLGADRQKLLNGQVTNDVLALRPGRGCYAALVNAKAKMLSDLNVYALEEEILLDLEPGYSVDVARRLEQFIIADDVQVVDAAPHYGLLSIQGPRAHRVVSLLGLFPSIPAEPLDFLSHADPGLGQLYLMNQPRTGSTGFDLFVPLTAVAAAADRLHAAVREAHGRACGWDALEIARIEAGIPRFGADMDDTIMPPEAGLEHRAVSYTKGCYCGQEVIARLRTYGQVAKALRGLRLADDLPELPPRGTRLFHDGRDVGFVTSAARSPRLGVPVALGYVRRECHAPGTTLALGAPQSPTPAVICPLPFAGPLLA